MRVAGLLLGCWAVSAIAAPAAPVRVEAARARIGAEVERRLRDAGVAHPRAMLLRIFKEERTLETWVAPAEEGPFVHLGDHSVCATSGGPGPKGRRGDGQVPEGVYRIVALNPWSRFHLSLRVDYPNAADRARNPGVPAAELGGDIYIHGNCVTIGCIPIGDAAIEEVYLLAQETRAGGGEVRVLILPARPGGPRWSRIVERGTPAEVSLWRSLEALSARLDRSHRWSPVQIRRDGTYAAD